MNENLTQNAPLLDNEKVDEVIDVNNTSLVESLDFNVDKKNQPKEEVETLEESSFNGFTPFIKDNIIEEVLDFNTESNGDKTKIDNDLISENNDILVEKSIINSDDSNSLITNEPVEVIETVNQNNDAVDKVIETSSENSDTLLEKYGENFSIKEYVCNPAIGRDSEIKQLILTLLTPEKSGILVGKPGIGKTAIVEGLGYQIQNGNVPDALKDYQIYKLNTSSLLGLMPGTNEPKIQVLLNEIKGQKKLILFIDEIHTLIGAGAEGDDSLDFANIFKPGLDRGNIKIIGATTSDEYDRYILTDKAFVRRFQKIDVQEPTKEHTVKILMGSLPKLEHKTGAKLKYTSFIQEKIMTFIVDLTTEYRRVYELSARYPDVALTILQQAFSYAVFDNKKEVGIRDVRKAIANTKLVYPDVIKKELIHFNEVFSDIYLMETPQRLKGEQ